MRRFVSLKWAALAAIAMLVALTGGPDSAAGEAASRVHSADLTASASVAGGERTVDSFHPVVFVFTLRNKGPATVDSSADLTYTSVQNGTVVDQLCIVSSGASFNADSPSCEYGALAPGGHARMTLIVQPDPDASQVPLRVRVCASNESEIPDPVPGNNCVTKSVFVV
jgi:hypothetical protein